MEQTTRELELLKEIKDLKRENRELWDELRECRTLAKLARLIGGLDSEAEKLHRRVCEFEDEKDIFMNGLEQLGIEIRMVGDRVKAIETANEESVLEKVE